MSHDILGTVRVNYNQDYLMCPIIYKSSHDDVMA